jgi:hypothetical protein
MKRSFVRLAWAVALWMACASASVSGRAAGPVKQVQHRTRPSSGFSPAVLKDGTNPYPWRFPGDPCAKQAPNTSVVVLKDGTAPYPWCFPGAPCLTERQS